MITSTTCSS